MEAKARGMRDTLGKERRSLPDMFLMGSCGTRDGSFDIPQGDHGHLAESIHGVLVVWRSLFSLVKSSLLPATLANGGTVED